MWTHSVVVAAILFGTLPAPARAESGEWIIEGRTWDGRVFIPPDVSFPTLEACESEIRISRSITRDALTEARARVNEPGGRLELRRQEKIAAITLSGVCRRR